MNLTVVLREWAESHEIDPASFSRKTGYGYQHAWGLLRGNRIATDETMGRVIRSYDPEISGDLLQRVAAVSEKPAE